MIIFVWLSLNLEYQKYQSPVKKCTKYALFSLHTFGGNSSPPSKKKSITVQLNCQNKTKEYEEDFSYGGGGSSRLNSFSTLEIFLFVKFFHDIYHTFFYMFLVIIKYNMFRAQNHYEKVATLTQLFLLL